MNDFKNDTLVFRAFCDESRLRIFDLIKRGETCSCFLLRDLTISQSTLSHHMRILVDSGLVLSTKHGKRSMYTLSPEGIANAREVFDNILKVDSTTGTGRDCRKQCDGQK